MKTLLDVALYVIRCLCAVPALLLSRWTRKQFACDWRRLGPSAALTLLDAQLCLKAASIFKRRGRGRQRIATLRLPNDPYPFFIRYGTSDFIVTRAVLGYEEYDVVGDMPPPAVVVDCGANIGCTSRYFLRRFPASRVIAVEPDGWNFDICRRNLEYFGPRVQVVHGAIWPRKEALRLERGLYRRGLETAIQVQTADKTEDDVVEGITIPELMDRCGLDAIDVLKIDIERAEVELFGDEEAAGWLRHVRNIVIELHDEECERVFWAAMRDFEFDRMRAGELTVCRNIRPKALAAA